MGLAGTRRPVASRGFSLRLALLFVLTLSTTSGPTLHIAERIETMATAIGNYQPSLVLTETIALQGIFPSRDSFNADMTLGMFHTYAFNFGMTSAPIAAGQLLAINQNQALFSLLGTSYGGDGRTTFALPDF